MTNNRKVEFPGMRYEMITSLKDLSDFEMQKRDWVIAKQTPNAPHTFSDNMCFPAEMLLDEGDLDKLDYATGKIGYWFIDEKEALICHKVGKILKQFTGTVGYDKPNNVYLTSPLWQEVVTSAKEAYDYIMSYEDLNELLYQEHTRYPIIHEEGRDRANFYTGYLTIYFFLTNYNKTLWNSKIDRLERHLRPSNQATRDEIKQLQGWEDFCDVIKKHNIPYVVPQYNEGENLYYNIYLKDLYTLMCHLLVGYSKEYKCPYFKELSETLSQHMQDDFDKSKIWADWTAAYSSAYHEMMKPSDGLKGLIT